jgi:Ca2+-binding RTX toxin-like protein
MSKLARTIPVAVLVATALMAVPSGAGAATQVGETFTPVPGNPNPCSGGFTFIQSTSPNGQYVVPLAGVITSWSFAANASPPSLKFKVGRSAGGNNFSIVGESAVKTPTPNQLNTYLESIAVQAGDLLGLYTSTTGDCVRAAAGYNYHFRMGDQLPGPPVPFVDASTAGAGPTQFDISALVESDCDKDGLGDETQDTNLSTCPAGTIPPPAPGAARATCKGKPATIVGTNGSDVRTGSQGRDVFAGLGGNDTLSGVAGNDLICGGKGKDNLKGGGGKDKLLGQAGKDRLKGGGANDVCTGGKGNDTAAKCEVEKSI